ncbi:hypothetical protein [Novosphingobium aromaticivorans]|uniref:hypothetical protein n=1 Tax=Novosphingobium aromaticivorans TaxID=48935 RepID=UPI0018DB77F3|nr:hypothetical protein [Novosphingobium aromaticivorans]
MPDKLNALVMSSDNPIVGPKTATQLRAFAAEPEPETATKDQVEVMIGKLAMATAQAKVSEAEASARLELYWLALSDIPVCDLRAAFVDLVRTSKFLPTPAEVRTAALLPGARRRYAKSRARHLAWLHDREWRAPIEAIRPDELEALKAEAGKALSA